MVTGDNLSTAMAIARQCGILTADGLAIEGPVFRALPQDKRRETALKLQVGAPHGARHTLGPRGGDQNSLSPPRD